MDQKEFSSLYVVQKDTHMDESSCEFPVPDSGIGNAIDNMRNGNNSDPILIDASSSMPTGSDGRCRSPCSSENNDNEKTDAASSDGKERVPSNTLEGSDDDVPMAPNLKIKIGGLGEDDGCVTATAEAITSSSPTPVPAYKYEMTRRSVAFEHFRRESMNFRRKVMKDFSEDNEDRDKHFSNAVSVITTSDMTYEPPIKRPKSSKHKKGKRERKRFWSTVPDSLTTTLIENSSNALPGEAPKLIIRIGKRKVDTEPPSCDGSVILRTASSTSSIANDESSQTTAPIRLKLARVSDGGRYVIGNKKRDKHSSRSHTMSSNMSSISSTSPSSTSSSSVLVSVPYSVPPTMTATTTATSAYGIIRTNLAITEGASSSVITSASQQQQQQKQQQQLLLQKQ